MLSSTWYYHKEGTQGSYFPGRNDCTHGHGFQIDFIDGVESVAYEVLLWSWSIGKTNEKGSHSTNCHVHLSDHDSINNVSPFHVRQISLRNLS